MNSIENLKPIIITFIMNELYYNLEAMVNKIRNNVFSGDQSYLNP